MTATRPNALEACDSFREYLRKTARWSRLWSYFSVTVLSVTTALIPILILASTRYYPFVLGKLLPSLLAAVAAVGTTWVTLRRPVATWVLFRRFEELLRVERLKYVHGVDEYAESGTADAMLIRKISELELDLFTAWSALVPSEADVASLGQASDRGSSSRATNR